MHLRDDDALGAVDDEGAVHGHERNIAHVHVLLLDVLDRLGAGLLVDIEHDEAQRHLERRGKGHAALAALVHVIFRRLELVADEFQHRGAREIGDREHRAEHRLQSLIRPPTRGFVDHQELVVGRLLNLDEVRHFRDFLDVSKELANAFATGECLLRHRGLSFRRPEGRTFRNSGCRRPSGLNFDPFRGSEPRARNGNVPDLFFRPAKRKTTREARGRTRSSQPSRHGLQKPEIAYLPTAYDGDATPPLKPAFRAADPIWVDNSRDSRTKPPNLYTFPCTAHSGRFRCTPLAVIPADPDTPANILAFKVTGRCYRPVTKIVRRAPPLPADDGTLHRRSPIT